MFCPNCGLENQESGTYCRRCGTMQPDPVGSGAGPISIRRMTRVQQIQRMRTLGIVSGGLSLFSAIIIIITLAQTDVRYGGTLMIAAICSVLVAIYQAINFYLGRKVFQPPTIENTAVANRPRHPLYAPPAEVSALPRRDTADLSVPSVADDTTRRLEPVDRKPRK